MANNLVKTVDTIVNTLMEETFWANDQSVESLTKALKNEVEEFISSFEIRDRTNSISEAGDVIMLLLCCLHHQIGDDEEKFLPQVLNEIKEKLHRRFSHLYPNKKEGYKQLSLFNDLQDNEALKNGKKEVVNKQVEDKILGKIEKKKNFKKNSHSVPIANVIMLIS